MENKYLNYINNDLIFCSINVKYIYQIKINYTYPLGIFLEIYPSFSSPTLQIMLKQIDSSSDLIWFEPFRLKCIELSKIYNSSIPLWMQSSFNTKELKCTHLKL